MRTVFYFFLGASILLAAQAYSSRPILIENAHILTMDDRDTVVNALLLHRSRIVAVGHHSTQVSSSLPHDCWYLSLPQWICKLVGVRRIDLQGRTVLPGFVDAHSHFPSSGLASVGLDLTPDLDATNETIKDFLLRVTAFAEVKSTSRWLLGFNYDNAHLQEGRHPTREELDLAAPDHAVYLWHRSGHMGVANTRALRELGMDPFSTELKHRSAGVVGRDEFGRMNGLLQERAAPDLRRLIQEIPFWKLPSVLRSSRDEYLKAGVTSIQNGYADRTIMRIVQWAQRLQLIKQRIVLWPAYDKLVRRATDVNKVAPLSVSDHINWPGADRTRLAVGAIKLIADGSPQGRTASVTKPYLADASLPENYRGVATIPESELHELVLKHQRAGLQLAIHGNGDAAIDSIIRGLTKAQTAVPRTDTRHILVHAQVIRPDQLLKLAALDATVSFFPSHTYYWGDWYLQRVFGSARAAAISPLRSAEQIGLRFSLHSDSPVTAMQPMHIVWSATERLTRSGHRLGDEQRIGRYRALRALTIDAAWQNFLDDDRGSLEPGKLADFIVLSDNPLLADDVRKISVQQVWIGSDLVYVE